jgi:hypothetical protein
MALPRPQALQDWLTQVWNIIFGRRVLLPADHWLVGPIGDAGGIHERVIAQIAERENLTVEKNPRSQGLLESFEVLPAVGGKVHPEIEAFYSRTTDYELDVWTKWSAFWGIFGGLVGRVFCKRIGQLNLPGDSMETAHGISSEIILLRGSDGAVRYRIWLRRLKKTGAVIYSGIYSHCTLPSGEKCLKVIFPLPYGSATVVMRATVDPAGNLELASRGSRYGAPGFYLLVEDRKRQLWKHLIARFHERIYVCWTESEGLRADHTMSLWGFQTYNLHYKIRKRVAPQKMLSPLLSPDFKK